MAGERGSGARVYGARRLQESGGVRSESGRAGARRGEQEEPGSHGPDSRRGQTLRQLGALAPSSLIESVVMRNSRWLLGFLLTVCAYGQNFEVGAGRREITPREPVPM